MSYQALYRRLRPQQFKDVIGQDHIIKTLENQIETGRINHAYLFCGTRGTGKTTTAKIFARAINCISDGEKPCNECSVCSAILKNNSINVVEVDAASNNSVENIREIIDSVKYPPTEGKYKVYIIDEVHMLSIAAFNAFLKTLEEPPEYAVFILATTDPQKMPVTVLSRCQRFDFHRITKEDMKKVLLEYMEKENREVDEDAIEYIAEVSDGAMRDALSILDQCLSFYYDRKITLDMVMDILGSVSKDVFFKLCDAINYNNTGLCLETVAEVARQGRDIIQFTNDLIAHFRNLLLAVTVEEDSGALDYSKEYIDRLKEQGKSMGYEYLINLVRDFSAIVPQMKQSFSPRMLLEVNIIKACNPVINSDKGSLLKRLKNLEMMVETGNFVKDTSLTKETDTPVATDASTQEKIEIKEAATPSDIKNVISNWNKFIGSLKEKDFLRPMLQAYSKAAYLEDNILSVVFINNGALIFMDNNFEKLKEAINNYFGKEFEVKIIDETKYIQRNKELYGFEEEKRKPFDKSEFNTLNIPVNFVDED